jgi:ABC-type glycerol-3-phosphate transport system substrate-binding protein
MADHQQPSRNARIQRMNRRAFLQVAGLATGAIVLGDMRPVAAGQAPAQLQGTRISYLQWVNFVPAHDAALKKQIAEFEKQTGAKVTFETINMNDIQARTTVAIESKAGPDIIQLTHNWPHLYEAGLEPVDDLAEELGRKGEGYYDLPKSHSFVNGHWRAVRIRSSPRLPPCTDWFKVVGYDKATGEGWGEGGEVWRRIVRRVHKGLIW